MVWTEDYFKMPFVRRVDGVVRFTQQGVRLVGNAILVFGALGIALAVAAVVMFIAKVL